MILFYFVNIMHAIYNLVAKLKLSFDTPCSKLPTFPCIYYIRNYFMQCTYHRNLIVELRDTYTKNIKALALYVIAVDNNFALLLIFYDSKYVTRMGSIFTDSSIISTKNLLVMRCSYAIIQAINLKK